MQSKTLELLNQQISKILGVAKNHGGGVSIVSATDQQIVLKLEGHCAGCPLASITYGVVLNKYIKEALPDIKEIKYVY